LKFHKKIRDLSLEHEQITSPVILTVRQTSLVEFGHKNDLNILKLVRSKAFMVLSPEEDTIAYPKGGTNSTPVVVCMCSLKVTRHVPKYEFHTLTYFEK
jgi:hypothetical protein